MQETSPSRPQDITSSSGTVLEPLTSGSTDVPGLVMIPILSVIISQLATEVTDEDTSLEPITGPHAMLVQVMVDQFFLYMGSVLLAVLQDTSAQEAVMTDFEGLVNSIRHFDSALVKRLA